MSQNQVEYCQLRLEETKPRVDSLTRIAYFQRYVAYQGNDIVAKSDEFVRDIEIWASEKKQNEQHQYADKVRETAYHQIFQQLINEGWEPLGTDGDGRVMSFKRTKVSQGNFIAELERLNQLKQQGVLTEEEFEIAKKKLLEK
ncbi:MAG: SHOCT domain-containing protein [Anaerolineales bacterium]|nr:MAG: SHOCT domain-containing protein [Anaerolineales bacterium]